MLKITKTFKYLSVAALVVLAVFSFATPAHAAFSLVSSVVAAGNGAGNNVTTGNINTTGADLLVAGIADYAILSPDTISDNKGNTWIGLTAITGATARWHFFYAKNPTVGTGHNFTQSGGGYGAIFVVAYSGSDLTAPFDVENGQTTTGSSGQAGSVTPNQANSLVVFGGNTWPGNYSSVNGGFTNQLSQTFIGGASFSGFFADLIQTSIAAANPTVTVDQSSEMNLSIAVFKPATSGGGGTPATRRRSPSPKIID